MHCLKSSQLKTCVKSVEGITVCYEAAKVFPGYWHGVLAAAKMLQDAAEEIQIVTGAVSQAFLAG